MVPAMWSVQVHRNEIQHVQDSWVLLISLGRPGKALLSE